MRDELKVTAKDLEESEEFILSIDECKTPGEFLRKMRSMSFDLWSAALSMTDYFLEYEIKEKVETEVFGPIFNQIVQGENFNVGVICFLLTKHYDTEEIEFMGFDT